MNNRAQDFEAAKAFCNLLAAASGVYLRPARPGYDWNGRPLFWCEAGTPPAALEVVARLSAK